MNCTFCQQPCTSRHWCYNHPAPIIRIRHFERQPCGLSHPHECRFEEIYMENMFIINNSCQQRIHFYQEKNSNRMKLGPIIMIQEGPANLDDIITFHNKFHKLKAFLWPPKQISNVHIVQKIVQKIKVIGVLIVIMMKLVLNFTLVIIK